MKLEIKEVVGGVLRITTTDERWYKVDDQYLPSVTWISSFYPKGTEFYKWLANTGWNEAEAIKVSAGNKGSKVHHAIEKLVSGEEVKHDSIFSNSSGEQEELTADEYEAIYSFANWFKAAQPRVISNEITVFSKKFGFAGTVDFICEINGSKYIIDFKTSQNVWSEYELQLSAYKQAVSEEMGEDIKLAILQIGYKRNKNKYKFTEIYDKFDLFLAAKNIWNEEVSKKDPLQRELPLTIKLK